MVVCAARAQPARRREALSGGRYSARRVSCVQRLLCAVLALSTLSGCLPASVLAGIAAAGSVAGAVHSFALVGDDIVAAVSIACQDVPAAKATSAELVRRGVRSVPSHMSLVAHADGLCSHVTPTTIDVASPAWVGQMVAKLEAPVP